MKTITARSHRMLCNSIMSDLLINFFLTKDLSELSTKSRFNDTFTKMLKKCFNKLFKKLNVVKLRAAAYSNNTSRLHPGWPISLKVGRDLSVVFVFCACFQLNCNVHIKLLLPKLNKEYIYFYYVFNVCVLFILSITYTGNRFLTDLALIFYTNCLLVSMIISIKGV